MIAIDEANILIEQLKERLKNVSEEKERDKARYARQLQFLEAENSDLAKKVNEWNDRYFEEKKKWNTSLKQLEAELNALKSSNLTSSGSVVQRAKSCPENREWESKFSELEQVASARIKDNEMLLRLNLSLENEVTQLRKSISSDSNKANDEDSIKNLRASEQMLKNEVEKLRKSFKNQQIMESEISSLKNQVLSMDSIIAASKNDSKMLHVLEAEKNELCRLFQDILTPDTNNSSDGSAKVTPIVIRSAFAKYQNLYTAALKDISDLKCQNGKLHGQIKALEGTVGSHSSNLLSLHRSESKYQILEQKLSLLEGENTRLLKMIRDYDVEYELVVKKLNKVKGPADISNLVVPVLPDILNLKNATIGSLEASLNEMRKQLGMPVIEGGDEGKKRKLSSNPCEESSVASDTVQSSSPSALADLRVQLQEKEWQIADLQAVQTILQNELFAFYKTFSIDVIPFREAEDTEDKKQFSRILHMKENPSADVAGSPVSLRVLYDQSGVHVSPCDKSQPLEGEGKASAVTGVDSSVIGANMTFLGDRSALLNRSITANAGKPSNGYDADKLNKRLKELFKERVAQFREAVYLLTGFKIDLLPAEGGMPKLRVTSMYAEQPEDYLLFQWNGSDKLELLETPYTSKIDSKILSFLQLSRSVPLFLANVNTELFERQSIV